MRLAPDTAKDICRIASEIPVLILGVEGGIWKDRKFEARLDAIWDGNFEAKTKTEISKSNVEAAKFIDRERINYNAFILTASKKM